MMRPDWDKITEEAFNSGEVHDFSADYRRRRAELQGEISMEKRRITQKTRRFNTRIAATAAALLVIPTATVGVLHFAPSGDKNDSSKLAAVVEEASASSEGQETTAVTEPATETETVTYAVTEAVTSDPLGAEEEVEPETEALTAGEAATQETTEHPLGVEVFLEPDADATEVVEATEVPRVIVALEDNDPSYLEGNYQMVFHDKVPENFVCAEDGVFYYEPPTNDKGASIAPSWFYNVNGSYNKVFDQLKNDMEYIGSVTDYDTDYATKDCEMFRSAGGTICLIKFPDTNFVGVLAVTENIENKVLEDFIGNIDLKTKAQLAEDSDEYLLVGGPSTNGLGDPEAACLDSDVFH